MFNLLSNAIKFTPEGGRVDIKTTRTGSWVKTEVRDTGIGIEKEKIACLFSEFYQVDKTRDEQLGGTGIGLALTRRLVELHRGEIGVESEPGKGSNFWFTLPCCELTGKKEHSETQDSSLTKDVPTGRRILLVEDNEINLMVSLGMLNMHNHQVAVARNGLEAIEQALQHKPELILMDIMMPVMDGLEATRRLREIPEFKNTHSERRIPAVEDNKINLKMILDVSRIEAGDMPISLVQLEAVVCLNNISDRFKPLAERKNLRIILHSDRDTVMIQSDDEYKWKIFDKFFQIQTVA